MAFDRTAFLALSPTQRQELVQEILDNHKGAVMSIVSDFLDMLPEAAFYADCPSAPPHLAAKYLGLVDASGLDIQVLLEDIGKVVSLEKGDALLNLPRYYSALQQAAEA